MLSFIKKHIHPITGLLFFVGLGLIGYYTIIDTQEFDDEGTVRIPVRLLTAEGMRPGTKIFVQGVQMGAVGALYYMTLDERGWPRSWSEENTRSHGQTVIAILYLKRGFQFYPNYRIITRYQTVLSAKVIEIEPGNAVPTFMRRHDKLEAKRARGITPTQLNLIPGVSGRIQYSAEERALLRAREQGEPYLLRPLNHISLSMEEELHFRRTGDLPHGPERELLAASNFNDPIFMIASVINENRTPIHQITSNLKDITQKLNQGNGAVAGLLNRPDVYAGSNEFMKDVIILTQELREGSEDLRETRAAVDFLDAMLVLIGGLI
ncbi:MAG: hypothetical protein KDK34_05000 [Leptospiraceae bacterium]|nr:hypothetical protein [Leptospiraceae bacterium]